MVQSYHALLSVKWIEVHHKLANESSTEITQKLKYFNVSNILTLKPGWDLNLEENKISMIFQEESKDKITLFTPMIIGFQACCLCLLKIYLPLLFLGVKIIITQP